jgi:diguanylate cyclase (GGDEF)-like protein
MLATQQIFLIASLLCFLVLLALSSVAAEGVRGMRALLLAALLGTAGNVLYAFGRELPPLLAYEAANVAYAGAGAALVAGYRVLAGRAPRTVLLSLLVALVGVLIALFHYVADSFTGRSAVISLFQSAVCLEIGRTVLAGRRDWQRPFHVYWFVLAMCALVALGHMGRMAWLLGAEQTPGSLLQPSVWSVAILTAAALALPALILGGLLTTHRHIVHRAEFAANHDHLTGAWSRKAFFEIATRERARSARAARPLALMLIDLDNFKAINDSGGHHAGDLALQLVAERARCTLRSVDCVARLGGDEFAVLLPDTGLGSAAGVGDKLQAVVRAAAGALPAVPGQPPLTLSIGVTVLADGETVQAALARADAALYAAKAAGRNRVHALAPEPHLVLAPAASSAPGQGPSAALAPILSFTPAPALPAAPAEDTVPLASKTG